MSGKRLLRTVFVVTCKPGKELRASEEALDLLLYCDESALAAPAGKGLVLGSAALSPDEAATCLEGRVSAYINWIYLGNEICESCKALKKGCLRDLEEGCEAFCVGRAVLRIKKALRSKRGVLVSALPRCRSGR